MSSVLLGGATVSDVQALASGQATADIHGWVPKGRKAEIAEKRSRIESIHDPSSTFCATGELYTCRTCTGVEFDLIVEFGTPQPSVGGTYRFELTDAENWCGNFEVQLLEATSCETETATDTTTETTTETTTDTTTETTTETTTDTTTTDTTTDTTETTTETTTDTTTETSTDTTTETTTDATTHPTS